MNFPEEKISVSSVLGLTKAKVLLIFCLVLSGCSQTVRISQLPGFSNKTQPVTCWKEPPLNTLEKLTVTSRQHQKIVRSGTKAVLALSSGDTKIAYSAGLLIGWSKTGTRPDFSTVTAYGASNLIAPFIFAGSNHDQKLADILHCSSNSLTDMAKLSASYLTTDVIQTIALKHNVGNRLLVTVPASPARSESVWDIGQILASKHPKAVEYIKDILIASVDGKIAFEPNSIQIPAGRKTKRNWNFRNSDIGREFLKPELSISENTALFVIHNDTFSIADSAKAHASIKPEPASSTKSAKSLYELSKLNKMGYFFIAMPERLSLPSDFSAYDSRYFRALFLHAYWQARRSIKWVKAL